LNIFIETITSAYPEIRNKSFFELCEGLLTVDKLVSAFSELDEFRKNTTNLYERVRASIFLYAGYRFMLIENTDIPSSGTIPVEGYENLLKRNFESAVLSFQSYVHERGYNSNIFSSLAESYHQLTFQVLADQVKKSVRSNRGNKWMFRVGHPDEHPLKIDPKLLQRNSRSHLYSILLEKTPVRMDLTHSCWSDIFFLGMDYPEGARVINISVDLGLYGREEEIKPPIESYLRIINEPVIRLTSLDLNATKDVSMLSDLFNFANDYLGLLKAGVIASGLIPPSFEGTNYSIEEILSRIISPGMGIEIVTKVNDIPKGSRLAVSTNLLSSIISVLMRATQQTESLEEKLTEQERRIIASRAILGEWFGGSGGGWQDSGGIWPGIKRIEGIAASFNDPEYNISRGCLLPQHKLLQIGDEVHPEFEERLASSLVLMHGGMTSNVGPILEMVTEKYLLRSKKEWEARQEANSIYDEIVTSIKEGDIKKLATLTTQNFNNPIKTIIPGATNHFTETSIEKVKKHFGSDYWGFLMLGGISGGGMGMFFNPSIQKEVKEILLNILQDTKEQMEKALPFAMKPVVYNFGINKVGSIAKLFSGGEALMPRKYYSMIIPSLAQKDSDRIPDLRKIEFDLVTELSNSENEAYPLLRSVVGSLFKFSNKVEAHEKQENDKETERIKKENGFDFIQHEQIRQDLIKGRIGLARNRLSAETTIEDVKNEDIILFDNLNDKNGLGKEAVRQDKTAVMCLAAGIGTRWTNGAGVIKAINPFLTMYNKHRSFIEIHLAKNKKTGMMFETKIPFIISTSYLTYEAIAGELKSSSDYFYNGDIYLSPGQSIGQRFIPMERDLRFLWEEMPQEQLDENKQKVQDALRQNLISWAKEKGEGSDYVDNISSQRLNPVGHWYEVPNMFRNGILKNMLTEHPTVEHIMLHNIDTLGANVSPEILNYHIQSGNALTFEVIPRHIDDRGGGLARINGRTRILEGLAQPNDEDELKLRYYNSMTTWINIDKLLEVFGLTKKNIFELPIEK
jgi:UDP-N-acetylglucosamine pyrophosphorylase